MLPIFEPDVKKQGHFTLLGALQKNWLQEHVFYYDDMLIHVHTYNEMHTYL